MAQAHAQTRISVDEGWRSWVAENVLLGVPAETLVSTMIASGIDRNAAREEIRQALTSPYVKGAQRLANRLQKRDWQLAVYSKLWQLHPSSEQLERRHRLAADEFLQLYYSANRPVIITGMLDDWPALNKWNLDYFETTVGEATVEIQFGRSTNSNYELERDRFVRHMLFREFIDLLRKQETTNDYYCTANNNSSNRRALASLWKDIVLISEYLNPKTSSDGFFWLGPRGTITPFHHDLTNNFMAQVLGRKLVKLVSSYEMPLMRNHFHCYSEWRGEELPAGGPAAPERPRVLECVLEPGEILFLPIGWWHYVEGLDLTTTISFTNFKWENDFHTFYTTYREV